MPDYRSRFTGDEIDEAVARMFEFDIATNGCVKLKSSEDDPFNLDYLRSPGNYVVFHFYNGSETMNTVRPCRISVLYVDDIITQISIILDQVQFRQYIDEMWTEWQTWYTTGYIYQQDTEPFSPQKNAIWIDTTDPLHPVLKCWNGYNWIEVRPSDTMDITIYDPEGKKTNIYEYIDKKIEEFDTSPNGESFFEQYQIHISDNTIHFTRSEKRELMAKPSEKELQQKIDKITEDTKQKIKDSVTDAIDEIDSIASLIETDSGRMDEHFDDTTIHVTPDKTAWWDSKADGNHTHELDGRVKINASDVISGVFDKSQIPAVAMENVCFVDTEEERLLLTTEKVQNGDTVCVKNGVTGTASMFYFVVDDTQLNSDDGYIPYAALLATEIPWDRIIDKPNTRDGYGIKDIPTYTEMIDFWDKCDGITSKYITTVYQKSSLIPKISGYLTLDFSKDSIHTVVMMNKFLYYSILDIQDEDCYINLYRINMNAETYPYSTDVPYVDEHGQLINAMQFPKSFLKLTEYYFVGGSLSPLYDANPSKCILIDDVDINSIDVESLFEEFGSNKRWIIDSKNSKCYEIEDGVVNLTDDDINIYLVNIKGNTFRFSGNKNSEVLTDSTIDIICECNMKYLYGDIYTIIHNRYVLALHQIKNHVQGIEDLSTFNNKTSLGSDSIILQTEIYDGEIYVLYLQARNVESSLNVDWKAFVLDLYISRVNVDSGMNMVIDSFKIKDGYDVLETGSSTTNDYYDMLNDIYLSHHNRPANTSKEYYMSKNNDAFVVFTNNRPVISMALRNWSEIYTKKVDLLNNTLSEISVTGSMVRKTIYNSKDTSILYMISESRHISYDGYNFYRIDDNSTYENQEYIYDCSKLIKIDDSYSLEIVQKKNGDNICTYGVMLTPQASDKIVDDAINRMSEEIEKSTGTISSNLSYQSTSIKPSSLVLLTGQNDQVISTLLCDYTEPNPTRCIYISHSEVHLEEFPPLVGAPPNYKNWYIKGGYYRSNQYLFILFEYSDGNPDIAFAILTDDAINILSYRQLSTYVIQDDLQKFILNISFKTYIDGKYMYSYMEFSKKDTVTGLSGLSNYLIIQTDYGIGQIDIRYPRFNDAFADDGRLTSTIRAYKFSNSIYLIRCNASYFTISVLNKDDLLMERAYEHRKIDFDCFNTNREKNIPEPFLLNNIFTFGYTNRNGNLVFTQIEFGKDVTNIDTGINVIDVDEHGMLQYNVIYESSSKSLVLVNVYQHNNTTGLYQTKNMFTYYLYNSNSLNTAGILYSGEIPNSILSAYSKDKSVFQFPEILKLIINYTLVLVGVSWYETYTSNEKETPVMRIIRDSGTETLAKAYSLTSEYVVNIAKYKEEFLSLKNQINTCSSYADAILEILG